VAEPVKRAVLRQPPSCPTRWIQVAVQWLGVGLAHGVVLAAVLQASPPPSRIMPSMMALGTLGTTTSRPMTEINMIPLIDVMLVLLVIFLVHKKRLAAQNACKPLIFW